MLKLGGSTGPGTFGLARSGVGVVSPDIEDLELLQVQVAVEGIGEHLIWGYQGIEGPGTKGD